MERGFVLKIKYLRAKNFLSIGNDDIEIDFTQYGNIVQIKGENRDHGPGASNGSGKTSIVEVIVYTFFGNLMKNLNHKEAINIKSKKGLETEVHFDLDGHNYKIVRKRIPDRLEFWEDEVDKSVGGIPTTQEEINKVIRLNYTAFINVVCFGQHNTQQFLACDSADKRSIAENLLSLDKYNRYCKVAKEKVKELEKQLEYLSTIYSQSLQDGTVGDRNLKQLLRQQGDWKSSQLNAIDRLQSQVGRAKAEMAKLISSEAKDVVSQLENINLEIADKQKQRAIKVDDLTKAQSKIDMLREEIQNLKLQSKEIQYRIKQIEKEIDNCLKHSQSMINNDGGKCPTCFGKVEKKNFQHILDHNNQQMKELKEEGMIGKQNHDVLQVKLKKYEQLFAQLYEAHNIGKTAEAYFNKSLRELEQKKTILNAHFRENADSATLLLEQQISHFNEQIEHRYKELNFNNPYIELINNQKTEIEKILLKTAELKEELGHLEGVKPYYEYWIKAFGDKGIRSFVLSEVTPLLNTRINYWLQFLIDNKIQLTFNSELKEKIETNPPGGDPFVYNSMSGGEHQRIDLGIALSFAQVMMLTASTCPSICCLDEVGTNLDRPGIQAVYNTICELSRDRQVLVTTHDPDLQELLNSYDTITVIKENGITRLKK